MTFEEELKSFETKYPKMSIEYDKQKNIIGFKTELGLVTVGAWISRQLYEIFKMGHWEKSIDGVYVQLQCNIEEQLLNLWDEGKFLRTIGVDHEK